MFIIFCGLAIYRTLQAKVQSRQRQKVQQAPNQAVPSLAVRLPANLAVLSLGLEVAAGPVVLKAWEPRVVHGEVHAPPVLGAPPLKAKLRVSYQ